MTLGRNDFIGDFEDLIDELEDDLDKTTSMVLYRIYDKLIEFGEEGKDFEISRGFLD